jgi:hypothetical protein
MLTSCSNSGGDDSTEPTTSPSPAAKTVARFEFYGDRDRDRGNGYVIAVDESWKSPLLVFQEGTKILDVELPRGGQYKWIINSCWTSPTGLMSDARSEWYGSGFFPEGQTTTIDLNGQNTTKTEHTRC